MSIIRYINKCIDKRIKKVIDTSNTVTINVHPTENHSKKDVFFNKAHESDSGYDIRLLTDSDNIVIEPGETIKLSTGLCFDIPLGWELQCRPRSGLSSKKQNVALGTIDSGYKGEVCVIYTNNSNANFTLYNNDRIAQIVVGKIYESTFNVKLEEIDVSTSDRGDAGFGSTGTK